MPTEPVDPILYTQQINAQRDIYLQQIKELNIADEELFSTSAANLIDTSNNINSIAIEIQTSATGLAEYDNYLNLTRIKDENDALTNSFLQAENAKNGSKTMIYDVKSEYNYQYYKNVQLFIGIIVIIGLSTKIFSGK